MSDTGSHKIVKTVYFILLCIIVLISIFDNDILLFYYRLKYPSPVIWNNVEISLDKTMIYGKDQNGITLTYPNGPDGGISVGKLIVNDFSEIDAALNKMDRIVLEKHRELLNGHESYFVKTKKSHDTEIDLRIFIPSINITVSYNGPEENYIYFKDIIYKINFNRLQK